MSSKRPRRNVNYAMMSGDAYDDDDFLDSLPLVKKMTLKRREPKSRLSITEKEFQEELKAVIQLSRLDGSEDRQRESGKPRVQGETRAQVHKAPQSRDSDQRNLTKINRITEKTNASDAIDAVLNLGDIPEFPSLVGEFENVGDDGNSSSVSPTQMLPIEVNVSHNLQINKLPPAITDTDYNCWSGFESDSSSLSDEFVVTKNITKKPITKKSEKVKSEKTPPKFQQQKFSAKKKSLSAKHIFSEKNKNILLVEIQKREKLPVRLVSSVYKKCQETDNIDNNLDSLITKASNESLPRAALSSEDDEHILETNQISPKIQESPLLTPSRCPSFTSSTVPAPGQRGCYRNINSTINRIGLVKTPFKSPVMETAARTNTESNSGSSTRSIVSTGLRLGLSRRAGLKSLHPGVVPGTGKI